jgi:hypothetical protein
MPFDHVGLILIGIALLLLIAVFTVNRRVFPDDRFAQGILWVIALPLCAYLFRLAALHWGSAV